VKINLVQ
ncbi:unnamed protein product, partial [Leptidea sinapis]